jgi:formate hydrogenlyase subunit 4
VNLVVALAVQVLHVALMLASAPTLIGVTSRMQARIVGRAGPPLLQSWRDLARLLRKQPVMAESSSEVFAVAPLLSVASVGIVVMLVPSFALGMAFAPFADLLVIAGLLALASCSIALAGMDAGSALGGMGANRAMMIAFLAEPALLLAIFTLALIAGSTNLDVIVAIQQENGMDWRTGVILALPALVLVGIADGANGPAAQAELAMQREATALEFSGRDLAVVEATEALRLLAWLNLIGAMFLPFGIAPAGTGLAALFLGLTCWLAKLLLLAGAFAVLRAVMGRTRLIHLPHMLGAAILLGILAVVFLFASVGIA